MHMEETDDICIQHGHAADVHTTSKTATDLMHPQHAVSGEHHAPPQ
jgi:hypothetical protein